MDFEKRIQLIIDYIEDHLQRIEEPVAHDQIAEMAGCSYELFQKVFAYITHVSMADYIRYRKMTLAGYALKSSKRKVIELSYQYGYDSPTSFTKAFQQFHGCTPKAARDQDSILKVFPKMQVWEDAKYCWQLIRKPSMHLIGKQIMLDMEAKYGIPKFWSDSQKNGDFAKLIQLDEGKPKGLFGVFTNDDNFHPTYYSIMVKSNHRCEDMVSIVLPEAVWAVFDCYGPVPQAVQNGWKYLREEWVVKYPFAHAAIPSLEWYSSGNSYDEQYHSQIWIPIIEEDT